MPSANVPAMPATPLTIGVQADVGGVRFAVHEARVVAPSRMANG
jgi:hypothetical protein